MNTTDVYCVIGTADGLQAPLGPFPDSQTAITTVAQLIANSPAPRALLRMHSNPAGAGLDGPDVLGFLTVNFDHGVTTTTEHPSELTWDDVYPELLSDAGTLDIARETAPETTATLSTPADAPDHETAEQTHETDMAAASSPARSGDDTTPNLEAPPAPLPVKATAPRHSRGKERRLGFGKSIQR